jgi:cytochrome c
MKRGKLLWLNCAACHYTEADQPGKTLTEKIGPNLHGLIGRPAGAAKGFTYSDAMLKSGLIWDKATLDRWIKRPTDVIPGTKMLYVGMANEADRQALIAYIESETSKK